LFANKSCRELLAVRECGKPVDPGRRIQSLGRFAALNVPCSVWQATHKATKVPPSRWSKSLNVMERTEDSEGRNGLKNVVKSDTLFELPTQRSFHGVVPWSRHAPR